MALILNIDTATENASVCISKDGLVLMQLENSDQKEHSAWLHIAVRELLKNVGLTINQLEAVAITAGPGSYTGLRVGMAAAKGICFALGIPLITENTLKVMALAALEQSTDPEIIIAPMIDARRMEVFTALFSRDLQELMPTCAIVLDENSFTDFLSSNRLLFVGSGSGKWQKISKNPHAFFAEPSFLATYLSKLSAEKYAQGKFTDNIYSEPVYTKEFYTHIKK